MSKYCLLQEKLKGLLSDGQKRVAEELRIILEADEKGGSPDPQGKIVELRRRVDALKVAQGCTGLLDMPRFRESQEILPNLLAELDSEGEIHSLAQEAQAEELAELDRRTEERQDLECRISEMRAQFLTILPHYRSVIVDQFSAFRRLKAAEGVLERGERKTAGKMPAKAPSLEVVCGASDVERAYGRNPPMLV